MRFEQRMYAHIKFLGLMAELYENEFEDFFHRLMCSRYPDFVDVRTAGRLGDMSADGLSSCCRSDREVWASNRSLVRVTVAGCGHEGRASW
ncbi:hypothetical protein AMK17_25710 [Streptomyces sp. CB00072]|nr:hypothetical protein AMK17_25710 [Streptomyces sp. CB00072]